MEKTSESITTVVEKMIRKELAFLKDEGFEIGTAVLYGSINDGSPRTNQVKKSDVDVIFLTVGESYPSEIGGFKIQEDGPGFRVSVDKAFDNKFPLSELSYYVMSPMRAVHLLKGFEEVCQDPRPLKTMVAYKDKMGICHKTTLGAFVRMGSWIFVAFETGNVFIGGLPSEVVEELTVARKSYKDFLERVERKT